MSDYFNKDGLGDFVAVKKRAKASGKKMTDLKKSNGEKDIVKSILLFLNSIPECSARKVHGSIYQASEPDIDCCLKGLAVKIEVKNVGEEVKENDSQDKALKRWRAAGAISFWTTSLVHTKQMLLYSGKMPADVVDYIKQYKD